MGSWVLPAPTPWAQSLGLLLSLLGCFLGGQRAFFFSPLFLPLFIIIIIAVVIRILLRILLCGEKFSDKTGSRALVPAGCYGAPRIFLPWAAVGGTCEDSLPPS